jgi:hypothetical protein
MEKEKKAREAANFRHHWVQLPPPEGVICGARGHFLEPEGAISSIRGSVPPATTLLSCWPVKGWQLGSLGRGLDGQEQLFEGGSGEGGEEKRASGIWE